MTIGTGQSKPPGGRHALLRLDEGPAEAVHLAVEAAGVAQVVAGAVPPPQRRLDGTAVHALATLGQVFQQVDAFTGCFLVCALTGPEMRQRSNQLPAKAG